MEIKKIFSSQEFFSFKLNWPGLLAFAAFWVYGLFGAVYVQTRAIQMLLAIILAAIFLYFFVLSQKPDAAATTISVTYQDVLVFVSLLIILGIFGFHNLQNSLQADQIYHSGHSQTHGIFFITKLAGFLPIIKNWVFRYLLWGFNFLFLAFGIFGFRLIKKTSPKIQAILFILAFIFFRAIVSLAGGMQDPHPQLRLLPLWLMSSIFSPDTFTFRLVSLLGLCLFLTWLYIFTKNRFSKLSSWLFALTVGTLPLLLHAGTLAEQSIWTAVFWSGLLIFASFDEFGKSNISWFIYFSLVSLFTLLRQTGFVTLIFLGPLFLLFIWQNKKTLSFKQICFICSPLLVMLPFLIKSFIVGTPATYIPGEVSYIPAHASSLARIFFAIHSGAILKAMVNSVTLPWLIFLPLGVIFLAVKSKTKAAAAGLFFLGALGAFYVIRPVLWGTGRYLAEFTLPFCLLGLFLFFGLVKNQKLITVACLMLLIFNIIIYKNLDTINAPVDARVQTDPSNIAVLSETVYNYNNALSAAKQQGLAGSEYIAGSSYGIFEEILNNFTVSQVLASNKIYQNLLGTRDAGKINNEQNLKEVIISDNTPAQAKILMQNLEKDGWHEGQKFINNNVGSTVYTLTR